VSEQRQAKRGDDAEALARYYVVRKVHDQRAWNARSHLGTQKLFRVAYV
jgi:hypothetical protein